MARPAGIPMSESQKLHRSRLVKRFIKEHPRKFRRFYLAGQAATRGSKKSEKFRKACSDRLKGRKLSLRHREAISRGHGCKDRMFGPPRKVARELCWKKAKRFCKRCNKKVPEKKRHLHHVNWDTHDNRQKNLVALCSGCHSYYHRILRQLKNLKKNLSTYPRKMRKMFWKVLKSREEIVK